MLSLDAQFVLNCYIYILNCKDFQFLLRSCILSYNKNMAEQTTSSLQKYKKVAMLGEGAFAKVYLVKNHQDQEIYALKAINKKVVLQKNQEKSIMSEKKVLSEISHPFLVSSKECFQDHSRLYFILDYCPGGQLFRLLSIKEKLSEPQCKFITAQIVLAIEALHQHEIIYCDLKPENVLIDGEGYVKITDFGLAKNLKGSDQEAMLVCGTPEYMAPQLLKKQGYTKSIDWWCLGCIIYEMVTGVPPFNFEDRKTLFKAIIQEPFYMPAVSPAMQSIISALLQKNPTDRLGTKGSQQVRKHHWFTGVDWNELKNKSYGSPFVPNLRSQDDLSNFDKEFTGSDIHDPEQERHQLFPTHFEFHGFKHVQK